MTGARPHVNVAVAMVQRCDGRGGANGIIGIAIL